MITFLSTVYQWCIGAQSQSKDQVAVDSQLFSKYYKSFAENTPPVPVPMNSRQISLSDLGKNLSTLSELISFYYQGKFMIENYEKMIQKVLPRVTQLENDMAYQLRYDYDRYLCFRISLAHAKNPEVYSDPKAWEKIAKEIEPCARKAFDELGVCIVGIFVGYMDREGFSASIFEERGSDYKPIYFDNQVLSTNRKRYYFEKLELAAPERVPALTDFFKNYSEAYQELIALVKERSEIHKEINSFTANKVKNFFYEKIEAEESRWGMKHFMSHQTV